MPMQAADIERLIKAKLPDADVQIQDLAGDGDHYQAVVVSKAFKGKSRVSSTRWSTRRSAARWAERYTR